MVNLNLRWTETSGQLTNPTPTFNINLHGHYYAMLSRSWRAYGSGGGVAYNDYRWLTNRYGQYYCWM